VLTEKSILREPKKNYMNDNQLDFFKERLLQQKNDIIDSLKETSENLQNQEREADDNDRASLEEERWLELRIRDREAKLLGKIDEALGRIDDGSYGYCEDTGDEIGIERILVRPTATLSIDAKQRRESIERGFSEG